MAKPLWERCLLLETRVGREASKDEVSSNPQVASGCGGVQSLLLPPARHAEESWAELWQEVGKARRACLPRESSMTSIASRLRREGVDPCGRQETGPVMTSQFSYTSPMHSADRRAQKKQIEKAVSEAQAGRRSRELSRFAQLRGSRSPSCWRSKASG